MTVEGMGVWDGLKESGMDFCKAATSSTHLFNYHQGNLTDVQYLLFQALVLCPMLSSSHPTFTLTWGTNSQWLLCAIALGAGRSLDHPHLERV